VSSPIVLLGPQHPEPTVAGVLRELGVRGPVAVVAAGLQERESEASALPALGVPAINLTLHARAEEVFGSDAALATAYKERQTQLRLMQDFYRIRLDHAAAAARAISVRHVAPAILAAERAVSLDTLRRLDQEHLDRSAALLAEFTERWRPLERPAVARHRDELQTLIDPTEAIVIAGGQIATLLNRLRLFELIELVGARPIVAWSAGAMVLSERVVLFHDHPPHGEPIAEVLDAGLGRVRGVVVLPDPHARLRLDDVERMGELAQRFAPAACLGMPSRARVTVKAGVVVEVDRVVRIEPDGIVEAILPDHRSAGQRQLDEFVP
jgi:hypothetical protein